MKLQIKGQIFPKAWDLADRVKKLREDRRQVNIGSGTVCYPVYEVDLSDQTRKEGIYYVTPQGVRLFHNPGDQYQIGYLISELDSDPLVKKHFKNNH